MKIACPNCRHVIELGELYLCHDYLYHDGKPCCPRCGKVITVESLIAAAGEQSIANLAKDLLLVDKVAKYRGELEKALRPNYSFGNDFVYRVEPTEEERKSLYYGAFLLDFILFSLLYIAVAFFFPGIKNLPWIVFLGGLVAARIADMVSTSIALAAGGIETNPLSDPDDISKLIPLQLFQVVGLAIISLLLDLVSPWLGKGVLFVFSLIGFGAAGANMIQVVIGPVVVVPVLGVSPSASSLSPLFYAAHIISFVVVGTVACLTMWIIW